jgi:hypothetical protein
MKSSLEARITMSPEILFAAIRNMKPQFDGGRRVHLRDLQPTKTAQSACDFWEQRHLRL